MSVILTINKSGFGGFGKNSPKERKKTTASVRNVLNMRASGRKTDEQAFRGKKENSIKKGLLGLFFVVVFSGIFYLYQVNGLATKGYELKKVKSSLTELQTDNEKNRIKEAELMSMYNIEKSTGNLNLISQSGVAYLEINGSVAMK